jgi:potassium efflux system protein
MIGAGLRRRLLSFALFGSLLAGMSIAQTPSQQGEPQSAAIARELEAVAADANVAAEQKTAIQESLRRALEAARRAEGFREAQNRWSQAKATVAERLAAAQQELQSLDGQPAVVPAANLALAELERGFAAAEQALATAQQAVAQADQEATRRAERRTAVPVRVAAVQEKLGGLPTTLADDEGVPSRVRTAQRTALAAERSELQAESASLQAELQCYEAEAELQRALRNLAARRVTAARATVDAWQPPLQAARAAAAQLAEQEARVAQLLADPRLAKIAAENAELAAEVKALVGQRDQADRSRLTAGSELAQLQQDFDEIKKRAELVGASEALGALLRQRRMQLADTTRRTQLAARARAGNAADAQYRGLEYDSRLRQLVEDPDAWLANRLADSAAGAEATPELLAEARRLREARRELLTQLSSGYENLVGTLLDVTAIERQLVETLGAYRRFVTERVLSIRSSKPLWYFDVPATANALAWLGKPEHWLEVGTGIGAAVFEPAWPVLAMLALLVLLGLRRRLSTSLQANGQVAARGTTVAFRPTALATLETVLLTAPLPLLLLLVGSRLAAHHGSTEFAKAVGVGAAHAALSLLPIVALRQVLRPRGLAESHFQWQSTTLAKLRSIVPWLLATAPFAFLLAVLEQPGDDNWLGSLGASLLAVELLCFLVAFWRLLHPTTGILGTQVPNLSGPLQRFRRLWFLLGVGTPAALFAMVLLGYEYTALHLTRRILATFGAVLAAVVVQGLVLRTLLVERRRLQSRRTQELLAAARAGGSDGAAAPAAALDPGALARQTQTMVRWIVGIVAAVLVFQIWVDVLPALGVLRRVTLWSTADADGQSVPVTLADALASVFVVLAAAVAARNLPALLELFVLQRLRMQQGERHAITTLARYFIVGVGIVLAFSTIGIGWSKVQWLVAAISVGLGFGLQEIFANFVSGLILLVERPIRVGDIVQIGETTGRVTQIKIRATTVMDWERKELIVPNREFVTGHFVNWTLTDGIVRRSIKLGVAYGSDTGKALEVLMDCAGRSPAVLAEPKPEAVFLGFGDSTLDLELRIFVDQNNLDQKQISNLLADIDTSFRAAGLEIAFPQRDVNIDLSERTVALLRQWR